MTVTAAVRLLLYSRSGNLGDMIQTAAMSRLLPPSAGIFRHSIHEDKRTDLPFVVNGYLNHQTSRVDTNTLFAGVFVGGGAVDHKAHHEWFKRSPHPVGARDPHTAEELRKNGVDAFFLGCATLTLPRYDGPRSGVYSVDCPGPGTRIGNVIPHEQSAAEQWRGATERLELLRTAETVYTTRLHIALPCLAMGTPVYIANPADTRVIEPERFTMLEELRVPFSKVTTVDTSPVRERFCKFLERHLGFEVVGGDYKQPSGGDG